MAKERYYGQRDRELRQMIGEEVHYEAMAMHNAMAPLEETKWSPRPHTTEYRVWATLAGPERGVDPEWWRTHYAGAVAHDVGVMSDEDVKAAIRFAKSKVPSDMKKARAKLVDLLKTAPSAAKPATAHPATPYVDKNPKKWSKLSADEKEDVIGEVRVAWAQAGRRLSRRQAIAIAIRTNDDIR